MHIFCSKGSLANVAGLIESGKIIAMPTDRWYMLCCDASNSSACEAIYDAKKRPNDKSLLLLVSSLREAQQLFNLNADARRLADAFWPGDLSMLLHWRDVQVGSHYPHVGSEVALVCCPSGVLGELTRKTTALLACTSANISTLGVTGNGPAVTLEEVQSFIADSSINVEAICDGGVCPVFNHTSIVDCSGEGAILVREGVVHKKALTAVLQAPKEHTR